MLIEISSFFVFFLFCSTSAIFVAKRIRVSTREEERGRGREGSNGVGGGCGKWARALGRVLPIGYASELRLCYLRRRWCIPWWTGDDHFSPLILPFDFMWFSILLSIFGCDCDCVVIVIVWVLVLWKLGFRWSGFGFLFVTS